jgi:hypothetical protein
MVSNSTFDTPLAWKRPMRTAILFSLLTLSASAAAAPAEPDPGESLQKLRETISRRFPVEIAPPGAEGSWIRRATSPADPSFPERLSFSRAIRMARRISVAVEPPAPGVELDPTVVAAQVEERLREAGLQIGERERPLPGDLLLCVRFLPTSSGGTCRLLLQRGVRTTRPGEWERVTLWERVVRFGPAEAGDGPQEPLLRSLRENLDSVIVAITAAKTGRSAPPAGPRLFVLPRGMAPR